MLVKHLEHGIYPRERGGIDISRCWQFLLKLTGTPSCLYGTAKRVSYAYGIVPSYPLVTFIHQETTAGRTWEVG
jgi:hypothetical protein